MNTEKLLAQIEQFRNERAESFGIVQIGVFGSAVRPATAEPNDVDVVVELDYPDMFALIGIKQELEERLNYPVDIVRYRPNMNAFLKERIDEEATYI